MAFSDPPLTARTLATRLARARFWAHSAPPAAEARDALVAAKLVASTRATRATRAVPQSMRGVMPPSTDSSLLERLYAHRPVLRLAPELGPELFLLEPRPPLRTALALLDFADSPQWCYAALRTELLRENFVAAFALVQRLQPLSSARVLGFSGACWSLGLVSAWLWSPAPPIAAMLALFWLVCGWLRGPSFARVKWHPAAHGWLYRRRHAPQLQMANQIMQYYEDIRGVTVDNFHVHAARRQDPALDRELHAALTRLGMEMRPARSTELYADYWSEQGYNYGSLEWQEPDQDPADLLLLAAAPRRLRQSTRP